MHQALKGLRGAKVTEDRPKEAFDRHTSPVHLRLCLCRSRRDLGPLGDMDSPTSSHPRRSAPAVGFVLTLLDGLTSGGLLRHHRWRRSLIEREMGKGVCSPYSIGPDSSKNGVHSQPALATALLSLAARTAKVNSPRFLGVFFPNFEAMMGKPIPVALANDTLLHYQTSSVIASPDRRSAALQ